MVISLYSLKPWYAGLLAPVRGALVARRVPPFVITIAGVAFGCAAGASLVLLRPGPAAGAAVAGWAVPLLAAIAVGSALTAVVRFGRLAQASVGAR